MCMRITDLDNGAKDDVGNLQLQYVHVGLFAVANFSSLENEGHMAKACVYTYAVNVSMTFTNFSSTSAESLNSNKPF